MEIEMSINLIYLREWHLKWPYKMIKMLKIEFGHICISKFEML